MPTTYAHDLFGKKVYKKLPAEMKQVIRKYGDLYRIGQHGPDILFYFLPNRKVVDLGISMHGESARDFFERGMELVRYMDDEPLLSYMLGFGCHYLLDSACHPFVNEMADKKVISHTILEKEFDRTLMLETGKNPYRYYPSDCIVPKGVYAETIHKALQEVSAGSILISLKMMKFLTNCMVYNNSGRRMRMIHLITRIYSKEKAEEALEHFMKKQPVGGSSEPVDELHGYFDRAVEAAPAELTELFALSKDPGTLSKRWNLTFNG